MPMHRSTLHSPHCAGVLSPGLQVEARKEGILSDPTLWQTALPPDPLLLFLAPVPGRMLPWLVRVLVLPLLLLPLGRAAPKDGATR
jgi:hypothetical protein